MNAVRNRVIHLIRHAESEFNVLANHQIDGFVPIVTKLDANLTENGFAQAQRLGERISNETINGYSIDNPLAPKNADIIITSPMTRTILTASNSLPFSKYLDKYVVRPEIHEQIENTTDIPVAKDELMIKFPDLKSQISLLPNCWWYRHPQYRNNENVSHPQHDADLLHSHNGAEPASESKDNVRTRVKWFFKWLFAENQQKYSNIVVYSHSCTILEMERFLRGIPDDIQSHESLSYMKNADVRSFELLENVSTIPISEYLIQNEAHLWSNFDGYYVPIAEKENVQM